MKQNHENMLTFHFRFKLEGGMTKNFLLKLDEETLNLLPDDRHDAPQWTALDYFRCSICALPDDRKFCPIALNLVELVEAFKDAVSYQEVDMYIKTPERIYSKHTTLQKGLSSLMGMYMVTSGCPTMDKLKPMARYHLPFATEEETRYRVLSMYLLAQYFLSRRGREADWELKHLVSMYQDIQILNKDFSERLSHVTVEDASLNAIAILSWFAEMLTFSINKETLLNDIERLFSAYFD